MFAISHIAKNKTFTQRMVANAQCKFIGCFNRNLIAMQKFGSHALRPTEQGGRIKVSDQVIWLNVLPPDGVPRRYAAMSGESLLEVLVRNSTAGIHPDCQGGD